MNFRILSCALLSAVVWVGGALAASSPEAIIITEGDITNRPYRIVGDVSVSVKKVGIVDRPPIEVKAETAIRAKAAELGADAVILVRYDRHGFTGLSMGRIDATGRAVVFGSGPAPTSQAPALSSGVPSSGVASTASPAPAPSAGSIADAYGSGKVRSYIEAINGGNVAAALALFDADVAVEDPLGAVQQGKAAAEAYVRGLVARGVKYELALPVRGGGPQAAAAVHIRSSAGLQSAILLFLLSPNGAIASVKAYGGAE